MECRVYLDLVAAHADGELIGRERADAEAHRSACPRCAEGFRQSSDMRRLVRRSAGVAPTPDALRRKVGALTGKVRFRVVSGTGPRVRMAMQGAIAAIAVLALAQIAGRSSTPMQLVADDVHAVARGEFEPVAGTPAPRTAPDLAARGWTVVGGREGVWGPMRGVMTVYKSSDGDTVVFHEMQAGPDFQMPPGGHPVGDRMEYCLDGVVVSIALRGSTVSCLAGRMSVDEFHRRVDG